MSEATPVAPPVRSVSVVRRLVVLLILVLLAGILVWAWMWNRQRQVVRTREAYELRNLVVAYLENGDLRAEEVLRELSRLAPNDPVVVRNLVIARLASLLKNKSPDGQDFIGPVQPEWLPDLQPLQTSEPNAASTWILTAMIHERMQQPQERLAALQKAVLVAPEPSVWYAILVTINDSPDLSSDPANQKLAREALEQLAKLSPRNLKVLFERAQSQCEAEDATVQATLETLRSVLAPLAPGVESRVRLNPLTLLGTVEEHVRAKRWPQAAAAMRPLHNIVKPDEWYASDLRELTRNHLSFIAYDFRPENFSREWLPREPEPPQVRVTFTEAKSPFSESARDVEVADFDLDDRPDVWALTEDTVHVAGQPEQLGNWQPLAKSLVAADTVGLLLADLDRDDKPALARDVQPPPADPEDSRVRRNICQPGDVDAVAYGRGGVSVLRNDRTADGSRTLVAVPQTSGLEKLRGIQAAILADIDHDGDLDLILGTDKGISLWGLQGDLQYVDMSGRSQLPENFVPKSFAACDWDRDVDLDVLVVGDAPAGQPTVGMLENLRHGTTRWKPLKLIPDDAKPMSISLLEFDGNVSWDVLIASSKGVHLTLTRTSPAQSVEVISTTVVNESAGICTTCDYDNDAQLDYVVLGGTEAAFHRGSGGAFVRDLPMGAKPPAEHRYACTAADIDSDGDLELLFATGEGVSLFNNDGGNANKWLSVKSLGEQDPLQGGDVNHLAIGSLMEVLTGTKYQAQVVTGPVTQFGLGQDTPQVLRVIWTNGLSQPVIDPAVNQILCKIHKPQTSCPYLYTWDGERYVFCTDACWAAPLGLQFAEGIYARPRAWEYLTIPGDKLRPKNGRYSVQMTEELWEATYLDRCELLAIDHPAGTRVVSNEKVGGPDLAKFKIHTVAEPKLPLAARDKHGRDVLERVAKEDGRYYRGFDGLKAQGLTDEHYLELDLGDLKDPKQITLFLTGWMFPTQTSTNMRLSQHTRLPVMRPPALWVPDEHGIWKEVRPFMGFPGGKTKTIAVDLSNAFLTNDHRLRIVTNMEFYWDAAWFTADDPAVEVKVTKLPVANANVHFRGFSANTYPQQFGPQHYDYDTVSTTLQFPPMRGRFTRYGDVSELLTAEDNRMVVFGSGDEITIEFDVPKDPPPEGWTRDFFLYNSGWDKDCDLNIVYGQETEPLPFQAMSGYPYGPDETYPETEATRHYLRTYQTRTQDRASFWSQLRCWSPAVR